MFSTPDNKCQNSILSSNLYPTLDGDIVTIMSSTDQDSKKCTGDVRVYIGSRIQLLFEYPAMYLALLRKYLVVGGRIRDMFVD